MMWYEILKNIQIGRQRTTSRDIVSPEDEEDCYKWFEKLYHIVQGEVVEPNLIKPGVDENFHEYTNEKLWCPLKNGIKLVRKPSKYEKGVTTFEFSSEVILSGERVNFNLQVDTPEANKKLEDLPDTTFYIFFELITTSFRFDTLYMQPATSQPDDKSLRWKYAGPPELQMKQYQEIAREVMLYMKEALS